MRPGEARPALIVLHGFGSTKNAGNVVNPAKLLSEMGYVTLRFDMRGCGNSEGAAGRVICLEQVADARNSITFMMGLPEVLPDRIGILGSSFGAAVAVYAAGIDQRVVCVISSGGWGNGERKFRSQHGSPEAWARFTDLLDRGRRYKRETGRSMMVSRYDIVPVPERLRTHVLLGSIQTFPAETAQSMFDFRAEDVISRISPRPILLLHSSADSVTPTEQSLAMYERAGHPKDLHLFAETDHFMFADANTRVRVIVRDWLNHFFPVRQVDAA
jgi:pimeloyl-ACP methyl ester carboxylesterase